MVEKESFEHLSEAERAVVGDSEDFDWAHPVTAEPAPRRRRTAQFSLRADEETVKELMAMASAQGVTFSELVREALVTYIQNAEVKTALTGVFSLANANVIFHGTMRGGWSQTRPSAPAPSITARSDKGELQEATTGTV